MKNRLAGHKFYLSGGIDRVPDRGVSWREDISQFLLSLDIGVLNPCDKPTNFGSEDSENIQWRNQSKEKAIALYEHGNINDANNICEAIYKNMKMVVAADMGMLDICNAVILHIDMSYHMCGSYFEMTYACLEKKPIIVHCEQGKMHVPDWVFGIIPHQFIFSTWNEVKSYIQHVAYDEHVEHFKRWRFFDMNKIYGREIF